VSEVEKHMPGTLGAVQEWYRVYKVAEGKPKNSYAFDDKALDRVRRPPALTHTADPRFLGASSHLRA
jgi:hypothetical protein